ncbi:hypothetical protein ISF6_3135 [Piscinibacter sakaiensis]|uniref:Uncharacterized protein n=1 Tax=Piscinibacter sakaiensis TaxID=1547922 RepID=A0A0K8P518_PISS1|nr:hypothetical protein ISF6_3135 [Piscinibacter sakaiensis]
MRRDRRARDGRRLRWGRCRGADAAQRSGPGDRAAAARARTPGTAEWGRVEARDGIKSTTVRF